MSNYNGSVTSRVCVVAVAPEDPLGIALDAPYLSITNADLSKAWSVDVTNSHDGVCSIRSGLIGDDESSSFSTSLTGPTNLTFFWRILASPQAHLDMLVDGSVSNTISGETSWLLQTLTLPVGPHTLTWTFRKEAGAGSVDADAAWVDQIFAGPNPRFNVPPSAQTVFDGHTVSFSADVAGTPPISMQWLRNGAPVAGATNPTLSFTAATGLAGMYSLVTSNDLGCITSTPVALMVEAPTLFFTASNDFSSVQNPNGAWSYGWMPTDFSQFNLYANSGSGYGGSPFWSREGAGDPPVIWQNVTGDTPWGVPPGWLSLHPGPDTEPSVLRWTAPLAGPVQITGQFLPGDGGLTEVAVRLNGQFLWQADDQGEFDLPANVHTGDTIDFAVYGGYYCGNTPLGVTISASTNPPAFAPVGIAIPPVAQTVLQNQSVMFSVGVLGTPPFSFQWCCNGHPVAGATTSSLVFTATTNLAGNYSVIVSNVYGFVTSEPVALVVNMPPPAIVTQPTNQIADPGATALFHVVASGTGPLTYQWQLNGANLPESSHFITTLAGHGIGDGLIALHANLNAPGSVTLDAAGNLFIADTARHRIRKVDTNGIITTVAGKDNPDHSGGYSGDGGPATDASLASPACVITDAAGNLLIADTGNNCIRLLDTNGIITTVVGNGSSGYFGDGDAATNASLNGPSSIALDAAANMFIADTWNQRIRKVDVSGIITTVAGSGPVGWSAGSYSGDKGPATNAALNCPQGVTVDASGNLLIADSNNSRVRRVDTSGIITTVAGNGTWADAGDGGLAIDAKLGRPSSVAVDASGNLLIADSWSERVRTVSPAGIITAVAGDGHSGDWYGDGGPALQSSLWNPNCVIVDPLGNLLIADSGNNRIRKVDGAGVITTVAGGWLGDDAKAGEALLHQPQGMVADANGNVFIADTQNDRIRKVDTTGIITTVAGNGASYWSSADDLGLAINARLTSPGGVAVDAAGNLFIADTGACSIRKVDTNGFRSTLAGHLWGWGSTGDGGPATEASVQPTALALDGAGNLFIADAGNHRIRKIDANGIITTVAGNGVGDYAGDAGAATNASLNSPRGVIVDATGNLFIADCDNHRIRKVDTNGIITTVAGNGNSSYSGDGDVAINASLNSPRSVALDADGNLFIADTGNQCVRQVDTNGFITTIAGNGTWGCSGDGGAATNATFSSPFGVAVDPFADLLIADQGNDRVRRVSLSRHKGPTLALRGVTIKDAGAYTVVVSNPWGSVTSDAATLILGLSITSQPVSQTVDLGGTASFSVAVAGSEPIGYQWLKDGVPIVAGTNATYTILGTQLTDAASFSVLVTNLFGSVLSSNAVLTVVVEPPSMVVHPTNVTVTVGQTACFSARATGSLPMTYSLMRGDEVLQSQSLSDASAVVFSVTANDPDAAGTYFIQACNSVGCANSADALLAVHVPPAMVLNPTNVTAVVGQTAYFPARASGSLPMTYSLMRGDTVVQTQTTSDDTGVVFPLTVIDPSFAGPYSIRASNDVGFTNSDNALLAVLVPPVITYNPWDTSVRVGQTAFFPVYATGSLPMTYSLMRGDTVVQTQTFYDNSELEFSFNVNAPSLAGDYFIQACNSAGCANSATARLTVLVPPVMVDNPTNLTVLVNQIASFSARATGALPITYSLMHDGAALRTQTITADTNVVFSIYASDPSDAGVYFISACNSVGCTNSSNAIVTVVAPPTLVVSPESASVLKGRSLTLTALADGTQPLSYQWFKNSTPMPPAATPNLSIGGAYSDTGYYYLVVTNNYGACTTSVAKVTVVPRFYSIQYCGTLGTSDGFPSSTAYGLNNLGEVVGTSDNHPGYPHAFFWSANPSPTMLDLGDLRQAQVPGPVARNAGYSGAYAINDNGNIVGYYDYNTNAPMDGMAHAALWITLSCGTPHGAGRCPIEGPYDLHDYSRFLYGSSAVAINQRNDIAVATGTAYYLVHQGFLLVAHNHFSGSPLPYASSPMATMADSYNQPFALNSSDLVVGQQGSTSPYLFDGTGWRGMSGFPIVSSGQVYRAVNDLGIIGGIYYSNAGVYNWGHAFLQYPDGKISILPDPWQSVSVTAMNNHNELVGTDYANRGILWTEGQWFVLRDLLTDDPGMTILANAINDSARLPARPAAWLAS